METDVTAHSYWNELSNWSTLYVNSLISLPRIIGYLLIICGKVENGYKSVILAYQHRLFYGGKL